ncbi:MAG: hypothetical protein GXO70_03035 [Acidobacteria bacterium]|nr:hypothetical protein [Acidobacteriota bacterium]
MKKMMVAREHIENIPELGELPIGKVLLLGLEMKESGLESYFHEENREIVINAGSVSIGEEESAYGKFALVISAEDLSLRKSPEMERLFIDLSSVLTDDGVVVAFFSSEMTANDMEGVFHTNRDIEQVVSRLLTVERIATMMDGTRRVVARK